MRSGSVRCLQAVVAAALICAAAAVAQAGVVVIASQADGLVRFAVKVGDTAPRQFSLQRGEVLPVSVDAGQKIRVGFLSGTERKTFDVAPYQIYFFHGSVKDGKLDLGHLGVGGQEGDEQDLIPDDAPLAAQIDPPAGGAETAAADPDQQLATLRVKILVDDDEKAVRTHWEDRLRKRIAKTSELLERYARVRLEVVAVGTWDTDDATTDFNQSLTEFIAEVDPSPADIAIGFASQYSVPEGRTHLGGTRGPFAKHILVREWAKHVSESERLEVILHELGHVLGAAHSPEPESVMRPILGDRKSRNAQFRVRFDPLNSLAMCVVGEHLGADPRKLTDLPPDARRRLVGIYATLALALPNDPAARQYVAMLGAVPPPAVRTARSGPTTLPQSIEHVIRGVVQQAIEQSQQQAGGAVDATGSAGEGDELTEAYVRAATKAAAGVPEAYRAKALALGLAVALGDAESLAANPATRKIVAVVEPAELHDLRVRVLGSPTMHDRRDLAQHFFVAAGIVAAVGEKLAVSASLLKEMNDGKGGSGFSFADLQADLAGMAFAEEAVQSADRMEEWGAAFRIADFLPDHASLEAPMTAEEIYAQYGSVTDARFLAKLDELRAGIKKLRGAKSAPAKPAESAARPSAAAPAAPASTP